MRYWLSNTYCGRKNSDSPLPISVIKELSNRLAPGKITGQGIAAMGHRISFTNPGWGDIPMLRTYADLIFEQSAGLGAAQPMPADCVRTGFSNRSMLRALIASSCVLADSSSAPYSRS